MKKNKFKYYLFIFIIPFAFVLSACNEPTIVNIDIMLNNEVVSNYIEKQYGDNSGLYGFSILAYYSDGKSQDITNQCQITVNTPDDEIIEYNSYLEKVYSSSLDSGYWTLMFKFNEFQKEYVINILEPVNPNFYNVELECLLNSDFAKNELPYGTKLSGISFSLYENNELIDASSVQNLGLYSLKDSTSYTETLRPTENLVERIDTLEYLEPGNYYFTVKIKKSGFSSNFTEFVKITITKAQIFVDTTDLKLEWSFSLNAPYSDVTLSQMQESQIGLNIYGGMLVLCNDFDNTNNDEYFNSNKNTIETLSPFFSHYGKFETVDPNLKLNASNEPQTIKVKFVPVGENNVYLLRESDAFDVTINIKQCKVDIPNIESNCCSNNHSFEPNKTHSLKILAPYSELYTSTANTNNINVDNNYKTYYTNKAENISITYTLNYKDNFVWNTTLTQSSNYNIYLNSNNNALTISMNVEKGNLNDRSISIEPYVIDAELDENNSIDLKLIDLIYGQDYLDGEYTWTILPTGYEINNSISLATGELTDKENQTNNSLVKTLTITDILSHAKDYKNITVAIKITAPESDNWLSYEKVFLVNIKQSINN